MSVTGGPVVEEAVRRLPAWPLRPFVAWYSGYRQVGLPPGRHRGLPSPYLTLIITLDDPLTLAAHPDPQQEPGQYRTLLGGLHTTPALISHPGRQTGVQLALEPLGVRALLGLPAGELAHVDVPADDVLGRLADELQQRLRAAPTWCDRFAILDDQLSRRLEPTRAPPGEVAEVWRRLMAVGGAGPVGDLADAVGWSSRHLAERFQQEVGLTPKAAGRVMRFDRTRRRLQRRVAAGAPAALADLAAAGGYYDQAHLAREFRALAGCSPSQWLAEELRNVQAMPDAAAPNWSL